MPASGVLASLPSIELADLQVLLVYAGGILAYGLVVNFFYQILSHRTMLGRKDGDRRVATGGRSFLYILSFPLISFAFFLLLAGALLFLSSGEQAAIPVFTIAMAVVLAVRVGAYINQPTSHDIAKMLPLGLLGVFLVKNEVTTLKDSLEQLRTLFTEWETIVAYFIVVIVVEYFLRAMYAIGRSMKGGQPPEEPPKTPAAKQAAHKPPARAPK